VKDFLKILHFAAQKKSTKPPEKSLITLETRPFPSEKAINLPSKPNFQNEVVSIATHANGKKVATCSR
jgi:hypothetical protein